MSSYGPTIAGVVGRLNEARLRLVAQGVLSAALWALTAGLVIFTGLELLSRLRQEWWQAAFGAQGMSALVLATSAGAVILAGGIVLAILRAPAIEQLARRADQTFGLRERISTALEIERRAPDNRSPVVAAMIADALRRSGAISPAELAAFHLPRSTVLLPLAVIAAAAVMFLPVQPIPAGNPADSRLSATLDADERVELVEDIGLVARVIKEEAISRGDTYMQAVANTLEDLGERIALSPGTTRGAVLEELGTLLEYATSAGSEWQGAAGERIPQLVEALESSSRCLGWISPRTPNPGSCSPDAAAIPSIDPGTAGDPAVPSSTSIESVLEEMEGRNDLARAAESSQMGASTETLDYIKAAPAGAAPRAQNNGQQNSEPQMFGAEADAGAAEEQLAGDGTEAIGDEAIAQPVDLETAAEMVLTGEDTGDGRSFEIEITPDTKLTEITDESLAASTDAWRRTTESDAERYAIGIDDRDTVSRYFRALLGPAQQ